MKWSLVLLAAFAIATASPIDKKNIQELLLSDEVNRNSVIEGQLIDLLENLRSTMVTGSGTVPVLDPLHVDYLAVDENVVPVPRLFLEIGDTSVTQLSTFVVDVLTVARTTLLPLRYRADLDLVIPELTIDAGHYNVFVPVNGVNIYGTGDAKISIIEPRITGHVIARVTLGFAALYIRIEQCEINFNLKGFEPRINGLLGGDPAVNDFINSFLRILVPDVVNMYQNEITQTLSPIVMDAANDFLSDFNLIGIIGGN